jgi:hypothetical protein
MARVGSGIDYLDRDAFRPWWDADSKKTEETVRAIGRFSRTTAVRPR